MIERGTLLTRRSIDEHELAATRHRHAIRELVRVADPAHTALHDAAEHVRKPLIRTLFSAVVLQRALRRYVSGQKQDAPCDVAANAACSSHVRSPGSGDGPPEEQRRAGPNIVYNSGADGNEHNR